jgi:hypothetical protein
VINRNVSFDVLPSIVTLSEINHIRNLLPVDLGFDADLDSVDKEATHEFYLTKNQSFDGIRAIPGKPDAADVTFKARLTTRQLLDEITAPILRDRITPFVNTHFARLYARKSKKNRKRKKRRGKQDRVLVPCFSLVRRYLSNERLTHPAHFDLQALVTVVVSLSSYGQDFGGGLYVSAGNETQRKFLALQSGDAVLHESDLDHGVCCNFAHLNAALTCSILQV